MWRVLCFLLIYLIKTSLGAGEISRLKCEEYSKAVNSRQFSPVLLPNIRTDIISDCGISAVPLIIGGIKAQIKEFPHMAIIGFGASPYSKLVWYCGGSLISEFFVLTAAHCMDSGQHGSAQRVRLGIITTQQDYGQELVISNKIPHPNYTPPKKYDDIALLKLAQVVKFTPTVRPACLNSYYTITNSKAIAIGFGKTSFEAPNGSDYLMKVELTIISNPQCKKQISTGLNELSLPFGLTDSMICAGEKSGGKDTCQGDSGGPLQVVLHKPYCMYSLIGITSFGTFCGFSNSPAFYTRISSYIGWIENIVWK